MPGLAAARGERYAVAFAGENVASGNFRRMTSRQSEILISPSTVRRKSRTHGSQATLEASFSDQLRRSAQKFVCCIIGALEKRAAGGSRYGDFCSGSPR